MNTGTWARRALLRVAAIAILIAGETGWARPWRPDQIPNGQRISCANCHINPAGGGPRNVFGQAVEAELVRLYGNAVNNPNSFWSAVLAVADSDGDGFSNGLELGDPAGIWRPGDLNPPGQVTSPGNPASKPSSANVPPSVSIRSPTNGAFFTSPATVTIEAQAIDSDGTVTNVEFLDGPISLGSVTSSPYSITVLLSSLGSHTLVVAATDNLGSRGAAAVMVTLRSNLPPTVAITSPTNGTILNVPANIAIEASAGDTDGSVTNVEFFDGAISLGSDDTSPYSITAVLSSPGTHLLSAVAADDRGATTTSARVRLPVLSTNGEPGVLDVDILDLSYSPSLLTITVGDTVRWTARGPLAHTVSSFSGLVNSGSMTNGDTFAVTFTNAGNYSYYCLAHGSFDSGGSQRGTIVVLPIAAPSVAITAPTNGTTFTTRDIIPITATATDPNGTVTKVEFFDSGQPLGMTTNEPFSVAASLSPGSHQLTAKATDNENGIATSSLISISVKTVAITNPIPERIPKGNLTIELRTVADNLISPLGMAVPDDGSGRMFVYDQAGIVWLMTAAGVSTNAVLDVRSRLVALNNYDERGLLGAATHPHFADNPLIYTYTSESNAGPADFTSIATNHNHQSVIAEWRMDPLNPNQVDPSTRRELLRIDKPQANHNGGTLRFGPDGFLYMSLGDGGQGDDQGPGHLPDGNAQSVENVYGKVLRIDVDGSDSHNGQYGLPVDNPFYGLGLVDEIFAFGLRNPFSYSFDRTTGELYLSDVGQNKVEEVDIIVNGGNYGWHIKEGTFYFDPNGSGAGYVTDTPLGWVPPDLIEPIAQYDHDDGSAAVGGYVYRGSKLAALEGRYVFGDWGSFAAPSGRLYYLDAVNAVREFRLGLDNRALGYWLKGFGEDASGELYVIGSRTLGPRGNTGRIFKIVPPPEPVRITDASANQAGSIITLTWNAVSGGLYQVQFKTGLNETNWNNLGNAIAATTTTMSASDTIGPDSQRFYRVVPLP